MKRVAHLFTAALLIAGCETSSTVSQGPNPVKCQVTLAAPPLMDASGGTGSLAITTQPECTWDATTTVNWISALAPASGQGTANVSFRVGANDGPSSRDGTIVVNGEPARVSQRAPCRYDIGPSNQSVSASGGAGSINVATTNECAWTAAAEAGWISLASSPAGSGNGTLSFVVAPNEGPTRSGAIVIANQRSTITQAASGGPTPPPPAPSPQPPPRSCTFSISPDSFKVDAGAGTGTIDVSAGVGCAWSAESRDSWITVTAGASGSGDGTVTFSYTENDGKKARKGAIGVAGKNATIDQDDQKGRK